MTDFNFVPTRRHPPGDFAFLGSLRRRHHLDLGFLGAPRAFTSGVPHPGLGSESEKMIAGFHGRTRGIWPSRDLRPFASHRC
ncbi:hypothetical protein Nwat_0933 [Nitrosococcus watsonii C-113]|uniref:Uncharacterized protein n=1 Tax=Nitrosococcus watsoni (strain C-113) TaxID=105559 RepID=D8K4I0_NITWC|nr:hypothetical protein Nwat_0933 [Nitrosococcus watsonii C-113]